MPGGRRLGRPTGRASWSSGTTLAYQFPERCARLVLVASGGAGREVTPLLRLASAPLAEVFMTPLHWSVTQPVVRRVLGLLGHLGSDLARDREHVSRILGGLPDGAARVAFTRTLRSVVDWRGQVVTLLDRCYLAESVPALLVWGDRDGVIPASHAAPRTPPCPAVAPAAATRRRLSWP
jgi:pimeloyl-ACP methyl ester carboxylesterase